MARLQLFSDLHADLRAIKKIDVPEGVDAVVVPGDVVGGDPYESFALLRSIVLEPTPIVYVLGNHEFYGRCHPEALKEARDHAATFNVTFLDDEAAVVASVRFLGATLWTDYALFGDHRREAAMLACQRGMNDHRGITWRNQPWTRFLPKEALALHRASRAFLERSLAEPFDGPTVVVTHHAPTPLSIPERFSNDTVSSAFASDLTGLVEGSGAALWLHGHLHDNFDYRVGRTRVVCNPHGYGRENPAFDGSMVLEVE